MNFNFFKVSLKVTATESQGETRDLSCAVHSSDGCQGEHCARPEAGVQLPPVPRGRRAIFWALLSSHVATELDGKWGSGDMHTPVPIWDVGITGDGFTLYSGNRNFNFLHQSKHFFSMKLYARNI